MKYFAWLLIGLVMQELVVVMAVAQSPAPVFLTQGWDAETRERFYFTPQGSHLIPYDWFLALERADGPQLLRNNENMRRLKFVTAPRSEKWNPDGLPVGFVKDSDSTTAAYNLKRQSLGSEFDEKSYAEGKDWLGFTCAACHTNQIECGNLTLQIDGAPSMADVETFLAEMAAGLDATHKYPDKFARFQQRLPVMDRQSGTLRKQVAEYSKALLALVERNRARHPYGHARLDAFGAILNSVCETALEIPANRAESNAPVSYPFLWDTPHMDWVQWNSSAKFAVARNVGEVLGVFGHFTVKPLKDEPQFSSTVRLKDLIWMEDEAIATLQAPAWPEQMFGTLERGRVQRGAVLFKKHCATCHHERDANGKLPTVEMPGQGARIETVSIPVAKIQTDPQMVMNLGHLADPGSMRDLLPEPFKMAPKVPRVILLKTAVTRIAGVRAQIEMVNIVRPPEEPKMPNGGAGYKARPLNGIWATAPYFHNGSVPSLYETLLPSNRRSPAFFVGSRRFNPIHVGFDTSNCDGGSLFRVLDENCQPIPGNSNHGHEGPGFTETKENGVWREFTDGERWDLVEYMKSLK